MHPTRRVVFGLLWAAAVAGHGPSSPAAPPRPIEVKLPSRNEPVSYTREIDEILGKKCTGCHSAILAENRLNLESVAGMLKGGKRGPAVVRGKADQSLLFQMASHRKEPVMPPRDKPINKPLSPEELGLLKVWIDAGAADDSADAGAADDEEARTIVLGELPPGVQPVGAVDMTADGARVAAGRANMVQVYDVDSGLEIVSLGGHKDLIHSARFSPDGTLLAAGSYRIITIWNAPTGHLDKALSGHAGAVLSLAVAAGGTTGYSGGLDKTVRVWNLAEGKLVRTLNQPAAVTALVVLPGGTTLASGGSDGVVRWLQCGDGVERAALKGHTAAVTELAVVPPSTGGTRIASVSEDGTGRIWTLPRVAEPSASQKTPEPPRESKAVVLRGHRGPVRGLAVAPDGQSILTGGDDGTLRVWSTSDGAPREILAPGFPGPILALAVSPDGQKILTGWGDKTARLLARSDGAVLQTLSGHNESVRSVAFSPGADQVATADALGGLKVWETATGIGVIAFGHTTAGAAAPKPVQRIAFAASGRLVSASADATLKAWRFAGTWTEYRALEQHVSRILALDFSPDGTLLAAGGGEPSHSGEVKIWQLGKRFLGSSLPSLHSDTVFALRYSPDGTQLASVSADKFLKVTRVADGKLIHSFEGHGHHVMAVDWRSDGKQLVTGGADNVLKVWDLESGDQLRTLQAAGKQVTAVRWVAGKPEVIGASGDSQVRVWNADDDGIARTFSGTGDYIYGVAASASGTRIAAGGADGVLLVWNGGNSQVIRKFEPPSPKEPGRAIQPQAQR
jgi:WD40 repeat protein